MGAGYRLLGDPTHQATDLSVVSDYFLHFFRGEAYAVEAAFFYYEYGEIL